MLDNRTVFAIVLVAEREVHLGTPLAGGWVPKQSGAAAGGIWGAAPSASKITVMQIMHAMGGWISKRPRRCRGGALEQVKACLLSLDQDGIAALIN